MYFNREDYGSRIRSLRKKRGLTQEQLAEKMNVSTPYIAKIETGKQTGPVELAVEFAAFFDVSLDYLLVGKGDFAEEQKRGLRMAIRNTGQLPMYLVQNHHEGIVERKTFDAVQAEMARRSAGKSPSKKNAPTGMTSYASKYALSERLVCGECGTLYRRCTWSKQGRKRIVWRCVSRLDYGTKYCHNSPTLDEELLQRAILAAINSVMSQKSTLIRQITSAMEMELAPVPGESMSLADIERRLDELNDQTRELVAEAARAEDASACTAQLRAIMNEASALKEKRAFIEEQRQSNAQALRRIEDAAAAMAQASTHISEWDEALIRQLVDTVKVNSAEKITVFLRGGVQVEQDMI